MMLSTHARVCAAVRPEVMHADDDGVAYFQTSGFALKLRCAVEETIRWMMYQCEGPALPHIAAETSFNGRQVQRARAAVARSLGAHADEIMLNECCAVGINYVAMGLEWRQGDVVVLTEHEHPSNRIPWYAIAERWGVQLHILGQQPGVDQTDQALLAELEAVLAEQGGCVRLLSASHVSRRTGARLPVTEMCALVKRTVPTARTLIDGAQVTHQIALMCRPSTASAQLMPHLCIRPWVQSKWTSNPLAAISMSPTAISIVSHPQAPAPSMSAARRSRGTY